MTMTGSEFDATQLWLSRIDSLADAIKGIDEKVDNVREDLSAVKGKLFDGWLTAIESSVKAMSSRVQALEKMALEPRHAKYDRMFGAAWKLMLALAAAAFGLNQLGLWKPNGAVLGRGQAIRIEVQSVPPERPTRVAVVDTQEAEPGAP